MVCGWKKFLQQNIRVIRGICGFKGKPQIRQIITNYSWAKWSVSQYFYITLPICVPKNLRVMTTSTPPRHTKKRLIKTVGAHTLCSCGYMQDGGLYFYIKDYQGNVRVVLNQRMLDCEGDEVQDIKKAIKVEWYIRQNVEPYEERKIQTYP